MSRPSLGTRGRRLATAAALAAIPLPCVARPLTLADLQQLEAVSRAYASPDGERLILETSAPYREAGVFDDDRLIVLARTRLFSLDPSAERPRLIPLAPGRGCTALGFSPSGRTLAVGCLFGRHLRLGLVDVRRQALRFTSDPVFGPRNGPSLRWRDERHLVLLEPLGDPDRVTFPNSIAGQAALQRRRRLQAFGRGADPLVFGSGVFADAPVPDTRVVLADLVSGRRRRLAQGAFDDLELSPDGRWAALTGAGGPSDLAAVRTVGVSDALAKRRLTLLDLRTGRLSRPAPDLDLAPTLLAWSGRDRLLAYARRDAAAGWSEGAYVIVDPRRTDVAAAPVGGLRPVVGSYGTEAFPIARGGWEDETPLVWGKVTGGEASWTALTAGGPARLAKAPASPSDALNLGKGLRGLFTGRDGPPPSAGRYGPGRRTLAGTSGTRLEEVRDAHGGVRVDLVRASGRSPVARLNAHLEDVTPVRPLQLTRQADTGREVSDWLYLPPGVPAPPLVVLPYPGLAPDAEPVAHLLGTPPPSPPAQLLTAHGYAVLVPSLPRSQGEEPAAHTLKDVLAAVDSANATGRVDVRRTAVWGHSFGGYAVLQLLTQTDRFRAAIAAAPQSDLISLYGAFSPEGRAPPLDPARRHVGFGWSETGQGGLGAPPWIDPDRYVRNSPIFGVDHVHTPLLMISGDQDLVGPAQAEEMFSALRRGDKDVELLVFSGEGHVIASPVDQARLYADAFHFLDDAFARDPAATPRAVGAPSRGAAVPDRLLRPARIGKGGS